MGVRVPRITLNADFGDESAFGELSLLSIGYGLHQTWVFATMFGTASVFGPTRTFQGLYESSVSLPYLISSCIYICALLFMAFTNQRLIKVYTTRALLCVGACLSCVGTLLLMAPMSTGFPFWELLSALMTGIGSAILIIYWGTAFARCDSASIVLNTAVAITVSIVLFATVLHYAPFPISGTATAIVPLLELAILWKKTPDAFFRRNDVPIFKPLPINQGKFVVRFGAPVLALGIALGMLRSNSLQNLMTKPEVGTRPLIVLAAGAATVIVLITIMALGNSDRWSRFFQPLVPFIAVTMFAIPFASTDNLLLTSVFLLVGFLCFESLMWIFFGDLSQRFRLSPIFVFGLGRGILAFAIMAGSLAPVAAANIAQDLPFGEETLVLVMLLIIVFAYALLPREREIEAIVAPCPLVKAVSASFERQEESERVTKARGCGDGAPNANVIASEPAAQASSAQQQVGENASEAVTPQVAQSIDAACKRTADNERATDGADSGNVAGDPVAANDGQDSASALGANAPMAEARNEQTSCSAAPAPGTHAQAAPGAEHGALRANEPAAAASASGRDIARGGGRFRGKCETVANTFLLSRRETEILFFLAKGHNAAYIQEKLYISEGTAKTHIRHIYRKCDVHNQQDLMRMVEDAQPTE